MPDLEALAKALSARPLVSGQPVANALINQGDSPIMNNLLGLYHALNPFKDATVGDLGEQAAYATPGVGNYLSGKDAVTAYNQGNWPGVGLGALGALPLGAGVIKAFHGSPHAFDKFDMSKMLSGIGHQTYGYGHNFDADINAARKFGPNVYETHINASPEQLLDFEKPLGKQGQSVRDALASIPDANLKPRMSGDQIFEELMYGGSQPRNAKQVSQMLNEAGIPGASYKVGGSPSQKYVIFSDDPLSIVNKH